MSEAKRIVVMDSSALLSTLMSFTDQHTHTAHALETLMTPPQEGGKPLIDRILIPDHVFYELTGILPISLPFMQQEFQQAKDTGNTKKRDDLIEMYVHASPRGDKREGSGKVKSHIRVLLNFIADHPHDVLVHTDISEKYCKRLKADYAMLSAVSDTNIQSYRPTFGDAFAHLGDDFKAGNLRVHIGQLMMMGLITEREFNDRMGADTSGLTKKTRFLHTSEMLDCLQGKPLISEDKKSSMYRSERDILTSKARELIEGNEKEKIKHIKDPAKKSEAHYLTLDFFEHYPILEHSLKSYRQKKPDQIQIKDIKPEPNAAKELLHEAIAPMPLLMEHFCYGGILPTNNVALLSAAQSLGLNTDDLSKDMSQHNLRRGLYQLGFFEISPTMAQLEDIQNHLKQQEIAAPILDAFVNKIEKRPDTLRSRFNAASKSNGNLKKQGLGYEKVFVDALINGSIAWDEFLKLVEKTHGLPRIVDGNLASHDAAVLVNKHENTIAFDQKGILCRKGMNAVGGYISDAAKVYIDGGKERDYFELPAQEMIERCHQEINHDHIANTRLYRVFESMLFPTVAHDASQVREQARELFGDDRLIQLEKDFANRHARKHNAQQPPYRSVIAAMHTVSRITRKNLGEIATLEAAQTASADAPHAEIWIINHDSDLFPDKTKRNKPQLEPSIPRQHAGLNPELANINYTAANNPKLHFVNTKQFLDTIRVQLRLDPSFAERAGQHEDQEDSKRTLPWGIKERAVVKHHSQSWQHHVQEAQESTQRPRR